MEADEVERRKRELAERYGPWTGHSIHLADDVYTFAPWFDSRLRRIVQNASDLLGGSLERRRVLDLACLEGQLGIEFALHGADVVGIEGREANLEKAKFARDVLRLSTLELLQGDVRDLSAEQHGSFDVILCAGILYHLDAPDVMDLVERIAGACTGIAIIDTHISLSEADSYRWRDRTYRGSFVEEHPPNASATEIEASLWYSLDNKRSFRFTRDSLCNLLRHVGFTSVFESLVPYEVYHSDWPKDSGPLVELEDRGTLIAVKGEPQRLLSSPYVDRHPDIDRLERSQVEDAAGILQRIGRHADRSLRRLLSLGRKSDRSDLLVGRSRPLWRKRR